VARAAACPLTPRGGSCPKAFGLAESIGPGLLFPTLPSAVEAYQQWAADAPAP